MDGIRRHAHFVKIWSCSAISARFSTPLQTAQALPGFEMGFRRGGHAFIVCPTIIL